MNESKQAELKERIERITGIEDITHYFLEDLLVELCDEYERLERIIKV